MTGVSSGGKRLAGSSFSSCCLRKLRLHSKELGERKLRKISATFAETSSPKWPPTPFLVSPQPPLRTATSSSSRVTPALEQTESRRTHHFDSPPYRRRSQLWRSC